MSIVDYGLSALRLYVWLLLQIQIGLIENMAICSIRILYLQNAYTKADMDFPVHPYLFFYKPQNQGVRRILSPADFVHLQLIVLRHILQSVYSSAFHFFEIIWPESGVVIH